MLKSVRKDAQGARVLRAGSPACAFLNLQNHKTPGSPTLGSASLGLADELAAPPCEDVQHPHLVNRKGEAVHELTSLSH